MGKEYTLEPISPDIDKANSYLRIAYETICNIHSDENYVCELDVFDGDGDDDNKYKIYERNYIISLASKFSENKLRLSCENLPGYVNGEVAKKLKINEFDNKSYLEKYIQIKRFKKASYKDREQIHVFPDFLIHDFNSFNLDSMNEKTQHLIMEAKTTKITKENEYLFFLDFLKLNFYLDKLRFDNAIYLLLGTPISDISDYVQDYLSNIGLICKNKLDRLYFIVQEKIKSKPQLFILEKKL